MIFEGGVTQVYPEASDPAADTNKPQTCLLLKVEPVLGKKRGKLTHQL